jgi:hypothetical protein
MRHIDFKHLGWLVSTVLYWCFVAPYLAWYIITTLKTGVAPDASSLFIAGMITIWYNWRQSNVGYGLTYWRNWKARYEDNIRKDNMRAKHERSRIEHHRRNEFDYDVIAK